MKITFYYTNKRINSLVRPDIDESVAISTTMTDFYLKDTTSINHPTFVIAASNMPETNYCILEEQGYTTNRPQKTYYWVNDIVQVRKTVWEVVCTVDALATWKDVIRSQTAFVARSSNLGSKWIVDDKIAVQSNTDITPVMRWLNPHFTNGWRNGCFIVRVATSSGSANMFGAIGTFAFTPTSAARFFRYLFTPSTMATLKNSFGSPEAAIVDAYWLPIGVNEFGGSAIGQIEVGGLPILVTDCIEVDFSFYRNTETFAHTLSAFNFDDFRGTVPYVKFVAKMPWVGMIDLDSNMITREIRRSGVGQNWRVEMCLDMMSGVLRYSFFYNNQPVGHAEASAKVDIPVAAYKANTAGLIQGAINNIGEKLGFAGGKPIGANDRWYVAHNTKTSIKDDFRGGLAAAAMGFVGGMSQHNGGSTNIIGGFNGTMLGLQDPEVVIYQYTNICNSSPDSLRDTVGCPYYHAVSLSSCTGYCLTDGFAVRGYMSAEEKTMIEGAFNGSGVFMTE